MTPLRSAALVLIGGTVGTLGRHGLAEWIATSSSWPWPTFAVNVIGSLALGIVVSVYRHPDHPRRLLLGTGTLGGFTTYSAFAVETDHLFRNDQIVLALLYPVATVVIGAAAAIAGMALTRRTTA